MSGGLSCNWTSALKKNTVCLMFRHKNIFICITKKDGKTLNLTEKNAAAVEKDCPYFEYFVIVFFNRITTREVSDRCKS